MLIGVLTSLSVLVTLTASAARPTFRADPDYLIDTWETEEGLPMGTVTCFAEDAAGAIWFSNGTGVFRGGRDKASRR